MAKNAVWVAWLIASLFYAYQYILRVIPNIMLPDIMQRFHIDAAIFGQFSGAYYIGYCLVHLPIGILLDRYGPRRVMTGCTLLTVLGLLPLVFAEHWIYPIMGRFLIGVGSSAAILGTFKIIRMTFEERYFTRMLSFSVTIGLMGAIYGGVPVSLLAHFYGYEWVIALFVGLGTALAIVTYLSVPDTAAERSTTVLADLKTVFANYRVIWVCVLAGLMVGPLEGFADAWGSEFLKLRYGFDASTAHFLTSMLYIGMCFGPVLSRIAEKTGYYLATIAGAGVVMGLIFVLLLMGIFNVYTMTVGFLLVGVACAYQILAIYKASTYVPEQVAGLTTALANMIIMSFGYVFHSSIGLVIQLFSNAGQKTAFAYGVAIIPMALLVATLGFVFLARQEIQRRPSVLPVTH